MSSLNMTYFTIFLLLSCLLLSTALPMNGSVIDWVDCAQHVPFTLDTTGLDLGSLPRTLHCGRVVVPMNYVKPIGLNNNITLGIAMYRPQSPQGVIFHSPGGTDEATIFAWEAALNLSQVFAGLEDYDLMMMDVRGTYSSNPLNVSLDAFGNLLGPYPTTQAEFDSLKNTSARVVQSWIANSSPPGILGHVGTREVVQDLETIRKALGYDKINFIGSSYGSFRAAQYASNFPEQVDNFVLDSVLPPGLDIFDQILSLVAAENRALARADAFCQNNASCPFRSLGRGSVPQAFRKVVSAARSRPLTASACINSSECISPVTPFNIQNGLLNLLYDAPDFPILLETLAGAASGDGSGFAEYAGDPIPGLDVVWAMPLMCSDYNLGNNTFEAFQNSFRGGEQKDTYGIGVTQGWQTLIVCSGWPFPTPPVAPPKFNAFILLHTADFDVNTPTEWARFSWKQYAQAGLVIRHGDDHVSFSLPDQPATQIAKNFLRTGKLPNARNETQVAVYTPGMSLQPIADPYNVATGPVAGDVDSS